MHNKTTIEIEKPVVPQWFDEWYKTFNNNGGNNAQALYYLNRTGWGQPLIDGNECEVKGYYEKLHTLFDFGYEYAKEYLSKAIIVGYEVEQPLYYAKVKGWELLKSQNKYWNKVKHLTSPMLSKLVIYGNTETVDYLPEMTKDEWNALGINETNADFEKVEQ